MSSPRQNLVAPLTHRSMSIESDMLAEMSANRRADDRPRRSGTYTFPASEQHSAAFSSSTGPPVLLRAEFAILSAGCRACFRGAREFAREFNNIVNARRVQFGVANAPARVRRVHPSHLLPPPPLPTSFRTSTPQPTPREPFVLPLALRRSTRCCRTGRTSSVGDMSITGTCW